ncbi:DGQHR domain-containing protein [Kocuria sp. M1R5S2]|uniref:DGQHR domain-containing protein n=1 Tax=Kocuria rhizosphaerae TaxID=3376285 RepID=UPI0037BAD646
MSNTFAALRAHMGSTPYFITTMTARELTKTARPAHENESWASLSIEDRMQREADMGRIKKQLVPYFAQHPDRFFGAIIVLVEEGALEFESLSEVAKLPNAYKSGVQGIGFLTDHGKGEHIVLDGQHRLIALREVITSQESLGPEQYKVGDDDVTVIFIENTDPRKTRRIFNKVNRYAKPTGRADNILTSEDDGYAIITRRLLEMNDHDGPLAPRPIYDEDGDPVLDTKTGKQAYQEVVNWRSNTLSKGMKHLTTISAVHDGVMQIAKFENFPDLDRIVTPNEKTLGKAYEAVEPWFETLLEEVNAFKNALEDPDTVRDVRFDNDDRHTLLLRPVGQIALIRGLVRAMGLSRDEKTKQPRLSLNTAIERINKVDFSAGQNSIWRDTIVRADGRMVARNEAYNLAANLLVHLIAPEYMDEEMKANLHTDWNNARGNTKEEGTLQDLPDPVA